MTSYKNIFLEAHASQGRVLSATESVCLSEGHTFVDSFLQLILDGKKLV